MFSFLPAGAGHATRCMHVAHGILEKRPDAKILFAGSGQGVPILKGNGFDVADIDYPFKSLIENTRRTRVGGVIKEVPRKRDMFLGFIRTPLYVFRLAKLIHRFKPDVIVSDCELGSMVTAKIMGTPSFLIFNMFYPGSEKYAAGRLPSAMFRLARGLMVVLSRKTFAPLMFDAEIRTRHKKKVVRMDYMATKRAHAAWKPGGSFKMLLIPSFASNVDESTYKRVVEGLEGLDGARLEMLYKKNGKGMRPKTFSPHERIERSDLVVCSGTTALMEVFEAKRPVIIIPTLGEQNEVGKYCKKMGTLELVYLEDIERLPEIVKGLMKRKERLFSMVREQQKLVNGVDMAAEEICGVKDESEPHL